MHESHIKHVEYGMFVMRQTHVGHVFGKSCIPTGKLMSDKQNEKHKA
jgi:hypothetical protein